VAAESHPETSFKAWLARTGDPSGRAVANLLRNTRTGLVPAEIDHVAEVLIRECERHDFAPDLVLALIEVESSGYNFARSRADALGLMQIQPPTGEFVAKRAGVPWYGRDTLFEPGSNVRLGVAYLRQLVDRFHSLPTALAAFNWGPARISEIVASGEPVPAVYSQRVLRAFDRRVQRGA
jgi:soluble lytic murein transglycosylase